MSEQGLMVHSNQGEKVMSMSRVHTLRIVLPCFLFCFQFLVAGIVVAGDPNAKARITFDPPSRTPKQKLQMCPPSASGNHTLDCIFDPEKLARWVTVSGGIDTVTGRQKQIKRVTRVLSINDMVLKSETYDLSADQLPVTSVRVYASVYTHDLDDNPESVTVKCNKPKTRKVTLEAQQDRDEANDGYTHTTAFYIFTMECLPCAPETETKGASQGTVPNSFFDQTTRVDFAVINLDTIFHVVNLNLSNALGWNISPTVPASIELESGESMNFDLLVTIPGGTPDGTFNTITLSSDLDGVSMSSSSATVSVGVLTLPKGACCISSSDGPSTCILDLTPSECAEFGGCYQGPDTQTCAISESGGCEPAFLRGDSDSNGRLQLSDAVRTLGWMFLGQGFPGCMDAADTNDDGTVDISDPIAGLNYLFSGSAAPKPPFPDVGCDPTPDLLGCGF